MYSVQSNNSLQAYSWQTALAVGAIAFASLLTPSSRAAAYDLSQDFSPTNNPAGTWSYGAKPALNGAFSLFGVRGLNPFEYWQLVPSQEPTIYRNGTANTITLGGGQGVFPPGTVFLYSGSNGASNGFGVVRFTVPAGGSTNYLVQAEVRPVYDGSLQGDTDFHVVKNGAELFGRFLTPADRSGYTNMLTLAAGDTVDFMVGRGADNNGTGSGLKMSLVMTPTGVTPPPPQLAHDLAGDFSGVNNPNGAWSYGAQPAFDGPFSLFGIHGTTPAENGVPIQYWQLVQLREPTIFHNGTTSTGYAASGQVTIPPGTTYLGSGTDGQSNAYCVARFTTPESGWYLISALARPVFDNPSLQGDTDFHVVKNGLELFGRNLAGSQTAAYSNVVQLAVGDTVDFMVGRGSDNSGNGSGLKLQARLVRQTTAPPTQQNRPPVAMVRLAPLFHLWPDETNQLVIAVDGEAAAVILNGSLSFDPDGDPLTYVWADIEQAQPFATGINVSNRFELGKHGVVLAVNDGEVMAEDLVTFEVITLVEAVGELTLAVEDSTLSRREKRPLLATLSAAAESFEHDRPRLGANQLRAFQEKVRALLGRTDWEFTRRLARAAQDVIRAVHRHLDDGEQFREHWSESDN